MGVFFKTLLIVIFVSALSTAEITYTINCKDDALRMSDNTVEQLVSEALGLQKDNVPYYRATVNVYTRDNSVADYFVTYLFRSDSYTSEVYRLDIEESKVVAVIPDYVEESSDEELCGACPDPGVEVLISYIEDALFPGSIQHGWGTYQMALGEGLTTELLIGHRETKSAVVNFLACPKLKVWGRIGHGTKNGITFNDYQGSLTASDIARMADDIKGKTFIFNSCLCHNPPFELAMIDAGAYFFAAGDISLSGGKEGVFSSFFTKAIKQKKELTQAMDEAIQENNYPNAWGYSGAEQPPYYLTFGVTEIPSTSAMNTESFSIMVTADRVLFNTNMDNPIAMFYIYNPLGKLIYQDNLAQAGSWDLTTTDGREVTNGNYIVVLKSKTGEYIVKQVFTIVK